MQTVQTSEGFADKIYFFQTAFFVEKALSQRASAGILLAFGGQTALNCGVDLYQSGVLEKYGVEVLGTPVQAIMDTEDRELFVKKLDEIDVKTIKSEAVSTTDDAIGMHELWAIRVIVRAAMRLAVSAGILRQTVSSWFRWWRRLCRSSAGACREVIERLERGRV